MDCPYFGSCKNNEHYGVYVCNLRGINMQNEYDHRDTYCNGINMKIDSLRPFLQCPYYKPTATDKLDKCCAYCGLVIPYSNSAYKCQLRNEFVNEMSVCNKWIPQKW